MDKLFKLKKLTENTFEAGPGGGSGTLNYGNVYGTPSGGNNTQDPSHFSSSDKTVNHFTPNTNSGSSVPKMPERPNNNKNNSMGGLTSPAANADKLAAEKPLNPDKGFDTQVDQLFSGKKYTPSPDEIMLGISHELGKMVKKDKSIAKQTVIKNLRKDSRYYSTLKDLNISDKDMTVDESSTFSKTKKVLDEMVFDSKNRFKKNNQLDSIFENLYKKRNIGK